METEAIEKGGLNNQATPFFLLRGQSKYGTYRSLKEGLNPKNSEMFPMGSPQFYSVGQLTSHVAR